MTGTRRLATAAAAFGTVAALGAAADHGWLADADRQAFEAVRARRGATVVRAARMVSALAEPGVGYPVLGLAGVIAARRGGGGMRVCRVWWWRAERWPGSACRG